MQTARPAILEPPEVFRYFLELCSIPRGSGNERAAADYLLRTIGGMGHRVRKDGAGNIIAHKPGTPGYENAGPLLLQAHMDMVAVKEPGSPHDFLKDPIIPMIDGDRLCARGTTLGADNGIGVAYALALLAAEEIAHPPLEAVFTVSEETGMDGARALDAAEFRARRMMNLDTEEEGVFIVGSAGGVRAQVRIPTVKEPRRAAFFELNLSGLHGGHSGLEIDRQYANANVLLGRALQTLRGDFPSLVLGALCGGEKDNAIPRASRAVIGLNHGGDALAERVRALEAAYRAEYGALEPGLTLACAPAASCPVYTEESLDRLLAALQLLPNGVLGMSKSVENAVETSCNLGVVREEETGVTFLLALRSGLAAQKQRVAAHIHCLAKLLGGNVSLDGDYPAWEASCESPLQALMAAAHREIYGESPRITTVHAGLECSVFGEKLPGMDMVSIGPDISGAHTPEETLSIASVGRVWAFLRLCLQNMRV